MARLSEFSVVGLAADSLRGARPRIGSQLLPDQFTLPAPAARQSLVLENVRGGNAVGQITEGLTFTSSDPHVVKIEDGAAIPVAGGKATLTAAAGDRKAKAEVTVTDMDKPFVWSFRNHVESVLSKSGCNSGACHGALAGKKGFKLSLGAFDPLADYFYITRQARARRVVLSDPGRSLVLTKPSGAVPHKGGVRFTVDSPEYRVLAEWIAAGAPAPQESDPRLNGLEILPAASVLKTGAKQPLVVRAHFSDGHAEDVTRWAKFTSSNESVATVSGMGLVQVIGHGEAAIKAWYLSWNVMATISVGYENNVARRHFARAERRNFIDELVLAKLKNLNLPPSPPASDAEFLRRAFIDTIGVLPTVAETRRFLADAAPDKRDKLIDNLLARPEFVDYWAYKWSDLLLVNSEKLQAGGDVVVLPLDSQQRGRQHALGPVRPQPRDCHRQHAGKRRGQFLRAAPRPAGAGRDGFGGLSWACRSIAPSATTIRWKNGPTTSITAWPTCSRACARKKRPATATGSCMR